MMKNMLSALIALALAPAASYMADPASGGGAAAPAAGTVQLTPDQLAQMMADAASKAVAAALAKVQPVKAQSNGGQQVRLKAELEPSHGDPVDRVGTVLGLSRRAIANGVEVEVLKVQFGDAVEEHVAGELVGA
jgi:hypothetical protein